MVSAVGNAAGRLLDEHHRHHQGDLRQPAAATASTSPLAITTHGRRRRLHVTAAPAGRSSPQQLRGGPVRYSGVNPPSFVSTRCQIGGGSRFRRPRLAVGGVGAISGRRLPHRARPPRRSPSSSSRTPVRQAGARPRRLGARQPLDGDVPADRRRRDRRARRPGRGRLRRARHPRAGAVPDSDGANQPAYDRLAAAGVDVRWSLPRFTYTHAKTFTVDHARLAVMTLNLTGAGLAGNREYAAIDDDPADVAAAEAIFTADALGAATGTPPAPVADLVARHQRARRCWRSSAARRASLALETEELTDPAIVDALLAARARGVAVTLVWPGPATGAGARLQRRWRRRARPSGPSTRRRSTPRSSSPTTARSTSGRRTSPPRRSTTTASSDSCWPSRDRGRGCARPSPTTPPAARHRRPDLRLGARYDSVVSTPDPRRPRADRQAYLEEQIQRQKRGEPIDVDWVKTELERVRREQTATLASPQRNLRWLVIGAAALLLGPVVEERRPLARRRARRRWASS